MIYNVISYLAQSVMKYPNQVALADGSSYMTYQEVWDHVSRAGNAISSRLRAANQAVVVCVDHSVSDVLAFLSVIFSGNFYVPIDLSAPADRIQHMIGTVMPAAVIASDVSKVPFDTESMAVWTQEELLAQANAGLEPWKTRKDTDLLYVMFTSGSTGVPKGVAICHRSVIDMVEQFYAVFQFGDNRVFGNQAPFDFDVSVKDIFLSLKGGGRLEILEKTLFSFPKLLIRRLNESRVDTIIWAVPAMKIIAGFHAFQKEKPLFLKDVLFSGETMPPKALDYWQTALPDVRYVNLYGPTEITCNCTYYIVGRPAGQNEVIPIGQPFPNCSVFLMDGNVQIREENQPGEICVTGTCLARGYYRRPELTAAAFAQNPLCTAVPEPMYRTGDIGCYQNGRLVFLGRNDTQIKHMGHRIELAEIELCANSADGVEVSACVYDAERTRIVLFYQGAAEPKCLSAVLRKKLPRYMLPARLIPVASFPQTRTGKIDRRKLLDIAGGK